MIKLTAIEGNRQWLDGGSMFGNAPRALWQRWTEVDDQDRIPLACRCLLIEWNGLKILCETGIGAFFEPKLAQRFGVQSSDHHVLLENLKKHNIEAEDIDYVILSHLHFDHAGGLLPTWQEMQDGKQGLVFPKAKFLVGKEAWERALSPHDRDRASFIPQLNQWLKESNRLVLIEDNKAPSEIAPIISFFQSEGHTPGQMHSLISSQGKTVVFAGDLIPGSPWVHLPITMGYDRYPEKLIEEKQKLYENFSAKNLSIFFTHDAKYAMGRLHKNEKGKYEVVDLLENFEDYSL